MATPSPATSYVSILPTGLLAVPVDPGSTPAEPGRRCTDSGAKLVLTSRSSVRGVPSLTVAKALVTAPGQPVEAAARLLVAETG